MHAVRLANGNYDVISPHDVLYVLACGEYQEIHTTEKRYVVNSRLKNIMPTYLQICSRSCSVNIRKIKSIHHDYLVMENGETVTLSRNYKQQILSNYELLG